jgi:hypothetical protein
MKLDDMWLTGWSCVYDLSLLGSPFQSTQCDNLVLAVDFINGLHTPVGSSGKLLTLVFCVIMSGCVEQGRSRGCKSVHALLASLVYNPLVLVFTGTASRPVG